MVGMGGRQERKQGQEELIRERQANAKPGMEINNKTEDRMTVGMEIENRKLNRNRRNRNRNRIQRLPQNWGV